ncbi:alpha/beta hydrolase [Paenibacillus senegalensis]|uniref:alpha/beta hydrolase n=1 Tax=Paenibacillus senegalensis TaxID=1465766 RepID=UPI000289BFFF|nr:alpha/beta hydrolase [Paenibacillus senegalensis]
MQKIEFYNNRSQKLAGHLYSRRSAKLIIAVHGLASDKTAGGRTPLIAEALGNAGYDVLAFDFSGCGESDDDKVSVARQVEDLKAAIAYGQSLGYRQIGLLGHSLGSLVSLKAYSDDIEAMVLYGALTHPLDYSWADYFSKEQQQQMETYGYAIVPKEAGPRAEVLIDRCLGEELTGIDPEEVLRPVQCPVLIIHGNHEQDALELAFLAGSKKALAYLPEGSRVEVIEGANHHFKEHVDQLTSLIINWFNERMKEQADDSL